MATPAWFTQLQDMAAKMGLPNNMWEPLAMSESALEPTAYNPVDANGGWSSGLLQLNEYGQGAGHNPQALLNPVTNAQIGFPYILAAYKKGKAAGYSGYTLLTYVAKNSGHWGDQLNPNLPTWYAQATAGTLAPGSTTANPPAAKGGKASAPSTKPTAPTGSGLEASLLSAAGGTTASMSILKPGTWFGAFGTIAMGVIVAALIVYAGIKAWQ